jgi:hypothetical protein
MQGNRATLGMANTVEVGLHTHIRLGSTRGSIAPRACKALSLRPTTVLVEVRSSGAASAKIPVTTSKLECDHADNSWAMHHRPAAHHTRALAVL